MADCPTCSKSKPAPTSPVRPPGWPQPGESLAPGDSVTEMVQAQAGPAIVGLQTNAATGQAWGVIGLGTPGVSASAAACITNGDPAGWSVGASGGVPVLGLAGPQASYSQAIPTDSIDHGNQICAGVYMGDPMGAQVTYTFPLPSSFLPNLPGGVYSLP